MAAEPKKKLKADKPTKLMIVTLIITYVVFTIIYANPSNQLTNAEERSLIVGVAIFSAAVIIVHQTYETIKVRREKKLKETS